MKEQWKEIEDSYYSVSNLGRIRNDNTKRILKGGIKNGYSYFTLRMRKNGSMQNVHFTSHRLVATFFLGTIPPGHVIHHIDADRLNNRVDNLVIIKEKINLSTKKMQSVLECPCCGCKINLAITGTY